MFRYILYRLAAMIPVLLGVSLLVFSLFWVVPGDVVDIMTGDNSWGDPSAAEAVRKSLNLDKPFYVQYGLWLGKVLRGDFGVSFISGQNVLSEILQRIPVNFQMIAMAMFFIILIGIPVGILSAYRQFSWFDHIVRFATTLGYSIPNFWAATIVVLLGSVYFKWLPVLNYVPFSENPLGNIKSMLLPGFVLGLSTLAFVTRLARSSSLDTLQAGLREDGPGKGGFRTGDPVCSCHEEFIDPGGDGSGGSGRHHDRWIRPDRRGLCPAGRGQFALDGDSAAGPDDGYRRDHVSGGR